MTNSKQCTRSPLPQELKDAAVKLVCVPKGGVRTFLQVAAKNCFWKFGSTILHRLASELRLSAEVKGVSLFELLKTMIMSVLKVDEEDALPILQLRVVRAMAADLLEDMLATDEAADLLHGVGEDDEVSVHCGSAAVCKEIREHDSARRCKLGCLLSGLGLLLIIKLATSRRLVCFGNDVPQPREDKALARIRHCLDRFKFMTCQHL